MAPAVPSALVRHFEFLRRAPVGWTLTACAFVLALRRFDQIQNPQFWAEDGSVFFLQARTLGNAALVEPSAGYYHTILRAVAWLASKIDLSLSPALYVLAAGVLTLYVAARTQSERFPLPPSRWYALAIVLIPDGYEVLLNLTNVQWILSIGLVLILIARDPIRLRSKLHDVSALTLLSLTGPFVLVLWPLFLWRAVARRSAISWTLAAVATACGGLQLKALLSSSELAAKAHGASQLFLAVPGARLVGSLLTGGWLDGRTPLIFSTIAGGAAVVGIALLAMRRGGARLERTWVACAFVGLGLAALYRCRDVLPQLLEPGLGGRYFYPLQLLAVWLMIALVKEGAVWPRRLAAGVLLGCAAMNMDRLREPALLDMDWPFYATQIRSGEQVLVTTNPANWEFTVPGHRAAKTARSVGMAPGGLVNTSIRGTVSPQHPASLSFVVRSTKPRTVLVRAIGPSLASFGVAQPLDRPVLKLQMNANLVTGFAPVVGGSHDSEIQDATDRSGAFALKPDARDAVALIQLAGGAYTATVTGDNCSGEVLLEVYEVPHCWYPARRTRGSRRR